MLTKKDIQQQIINLEQQERQMFAQANFALGQKSVLQSLLAELPDDPVPEVGPTLTVVPDPIPERVRPVLTVVPNPAPTEEEGQ